MQNGVLPTFALADPAEWERMKEKLSVNWYGQSVVLFAATWANRMESALAEGQTVAACSGMLACAVDEEMDGTADNVYGYAVEILCKVWKHGQELFTVYRTRLRPGT